MMDYLNGRDAAMTMLVARGYTQQEAEKMVAEAKGEMTLKSVAMDIAKQRGISISQAYRILQKERQSGNQRIETEPAQEGWSKKDHVLEALYRMNANGGVDASTLMGMLTSMQVKTNIQELNTILWDHQKQQNVKFNERHGSGGSVLSRIRLTPLGRGRIVEKRGTPQQAAIRVNAKSHNERGMSHATTRGATHQVGIDKTYYRNHRKVAEGGPVEIIRPGVKPEVVPAPEYKPVEAKPLGDPLPQNMKSDLPNPEAQVITDTWEANKTVGLKPDLENYPHISELLRRFEEKKGLRERAAKLVEAASIISDVDPEEAERLMQRAADMEGPSLSKLEIEVVKFVGEVM